ncbi:MAG TPA: HAD-IA family hydrolase [Polyangia bacterium]
MTLAALIFDVDGTLAETEESHRQAFNGAFAAAGLDWRWDQALYRELLQVAGGVERMRHFAATHRERRQLGEPELRAIHREKTARFVARAAHHRPRPGVARLVAEARAAGLRLAIATTTARANVAALLTACGGEAWFDVIATAEDAARKKPDPAIYAVALGRLGLPAAGCLAFEDTRNGLAAARAAGVPVAITFSQYGERDGFDGAVAVVPDLAAVDLAQLRAWHAAARQR